jgi:hypothetical protein
VHTTSLTWASLAPVCFQCLGAAWPRVQSYASRCKTYPTHLAWIRGTGSSFVLVSSARLGLKWHFQAQACVCDIRHAFVAVAAVHRRLLLAQLATEGVVGAQEHLSLASAGKGPAMSVHIGLSASRKAYALCTPDNQHFSYPTLLHDIWSRQHACVSLGRPASPPQHCLCAFVSVILWCTSTNTWP